MIVKTKNGLFANAGYGGGTFNGNVGFGEYSDMRKHQYRDLSNLNAPYDALSVQGLGVFGTAGLGADASSSSAPIMSTNETPWMIASDKTRSIQGLMNTKLMMDGYIPLKEDGILGPRTCGALQMYGSLDKAGGSCEPHASEFILPTKGTPSAPPIVAEHKSSSAAWLWAVLAGAGAIGLVVYLKKKRH